MASKMLTIGLVFGMFVGRLSAQSPDELNSWLKEIRPDLEKALGYSLPKLPLVETASVASQADPDVAACVKWLWPHLKDDALGRALEDAQAVMALASVARLMEGTNVILMHPENQIGGWDNLEKALRAHLLKLAIVHETVRYALDGRYDLAKRRNACQDAEEWFALHAVIEGRAQWVTHQLARKLEMEETMPLLVDSFLNVPDHDSDPALRAISQSVVQKRRWAYQDGLAFFEYLENQRLGDVEKLVFSRPPKLTRWIEEPELYVRSSKRPDLARLFWKMENDSPLGAGWHADQFAWTDEMMSQILASISSDKELTQRIIDSWKEGRYLVWMNRYDGRHATVSVMRLKTPEAARMAYRFTCTVREKSAATNNVKAKSQSIRLPNVAEAMQIQTTQGSIVTDNIMACAGSTVIDISFTGTADRAWMERVVDMISAADR